MFGKYITAEWNINLLSLIAPMVFSNVYLSRKPPH